MVGQPQLIVTALLFMLLKKFRGSWSVLESNEKIQFVKSLVPHVLMETSVMNYAHLISTNKRILESRGIKVNGISYVIYQNAA